MPNNTTADHPDSSYAEVPVDIAEKIWDQHPENPCNWRESQKFRVSDAGLPNSFWPVTVWNTGAAVGPMIGLPLLENFGVRNGYLVNDSQ